MFLDGGVQEEELDIAKEESDVIGDDDDVDDDDIDRMKMMTSTSSPTSSDHTLPLACNLERYAESDNIFNR